MSDRDDGSPSDEAPLDLSPWAAPTPPRGLTSRVMATVRAGGGAAPDVTLDTRPAPAAPGLRRWRGVIGGLAVGLAAAGALWTLWPHPPRERPSAGAVTAAAPSKLALGDGTVALLAAGATLSWHRDGAALAVTHSAGAVTYQHAGPAALVVTTPGATVRTTRATLLVEVPVNKPLIAGVAGAAITAAVVIAVYEGRAEVHEPGASPRVVDSGAQVAVALPAPARPTFQPVARAVKDRAQRDALAAAIAAVRAQPAGGAVARTAGGAAPPSTSGVGGTVGAAPAPAALDPTPGELSKDEIRTGVREVIPLLADCYSATLEKHPTLAGKVVAHLTVDSEPDLGTIVTMHDDSELAMNVTGKDADPRALKADLGELGECLGATLESIALPPLGDKDGGHVEITYPIEFAPSEDEAPPPAPTADKPAARRPPPPPLPEVGEIGDFAALLKAAEDAAKGARWSHALAYVQAALARFPSAEPMLRGRAHMVGALAACNLGRAADAKAHYRDALPAARTLIRQRCLSNSIEVD